MPCMKDKLANEKSVCFTLFLHELTQSNGREKLRDGMLKVASRKENTLPFFLKHSVHIIRTGCPRKIDTARNLSVRATC